MAVDDVHETPNLLDKVWQWYFYCFLTTFLVCLPLMLPILLCVAMLTNTFGAGYGVDKVVWHDDALTQFFIGFSITLVCSLALFVSYILWLRERREGYLKADFPDVSYGSYSWRMIGCSLGTGVAIYLAVTLVDRGVHVSHLQDEKAELTLKVIEGESRAYSAPWLPIIAGLSVGFGLWCLNWKKAATYVPMSTPNGWLLWFKQIVCAMVYLFISWGVFLLAMRLLKKGEDEDYPNLYWPLIIGAFCGGLIVWLLVFVNAQVRPEYKPITRVLNWAKDKLGDIMQDPLWKNWHRRLPIALIVWSVWLVLLWFAWPNKAEKTLGFVIILIGFATTIAAFFRSRKALFAACLAANLMAAVALLTWLPSQQAITTSILAVLYPLAPLLIPITVALMICYNPCGAGHLFARLWQAAQETSASEPDEAVAIHGAPTALLLGWIFFVILDSLPRVASPVPMVCALLFALIGIYGFVAYMLRGALAPIITSLVLLAILSGVNRYKFRFPDALDRYETNAANTPLATGPLQLTALLENDQKLINKEWDAITRYSNAIYKLESSQERIASLTMALSMADSDQVQLIKDELKREEDKEEEGKREALKTRPAAITAFLSLEGETRVIEAPFPRGLRQRLEIEDKPEFLLRTEDMDWLRYGTLAKAGAYEAQAGDGRKPLILIAVSGGALRSAVWTHLILGRLEEAFAHSHKKLDFPAHVRLITGASGGMLGASHYVATLKKPQERLVGGNRQTELDEEVDRLRKDCLTPLMRQFVFGDVPSLLSPWPAKHDRGKALEDAWSDNLDGALSIHFDNLRQKEKEGWCPSLALTPMMIEDGRRLIISNLSLFGPISNDGSAAYLKDAEELTRDLVIRGVPQVEATQLVKDFPHHRIVWQMKQYDYFNKFPDKRRIDDKRFTSMATMIRTNAPIDPGAKEDLHAGNYSIEALELFRLLPKAKANIKLSTAVRMSASFPFFAPVVSLPTWPRRRVVDAGYYDNYGVSLCANWLFSGQNAVWLQENVNKVCIIQIRDGVSDMYRRLEKVKPDRSSELTRATEEFFSPLEGLDNARVSSTSFRNDGQLELLSQWLKQQGFEFLVVNFEYPGRAAMSWRLSEREFDDLKVRANSDEVKGRIGYLLDFLYGDDDK